MITLKKAMSSPQSTRLISYDFKRAFYVLFYLIIFLESHFNSNEPRSRQVHQDAEARIWSLVCRAPEKYLGSISHYHQINLIWGPLCLWHRSRRWSDLWHGIKHIESVSISTLEKGLGAIWIWKELIPMQKCEGPWLQISLKFLVIIF